MKMFKSSYSPSTIKKALLMYENYRSFRKVAYCFSISKSTLHRWWTYFHRFLSKPRIQKKKTKSPYVTKYNKLHLLIHNLFKARNTKHPLRSLGDFLNIFQNHGLNPSIATIQRYLKKERISRRYSNIFEVNRYSQKQIRTAWLEFYQRIRNIPNEHILCLDETSFSNHNLRLYHYLPKGEKVNKTTIAKREKRSFVFAINAQEIIHYAEREKAFDKKTFIAFLESLLEKNKLYPMKHIIMDNVAFHKSHEVRCLCQKYDIDIIYTPPYSPFCNPIEEVFASLKSTSKRFIHHAFSERLRFTMNDFKCSNNKNFIPYFDHMRKLLSKKINTPKKDI